MKKFKTLMATLLALTLLFGGTTTAFAAEEGDTTYKNTDIQDNLNTKTIDVTISYTKGDDVTDPETGGDDTEKSIYNIVIDYDDLDYSYEAAAIAWNATDLVYNITTKPIGTTSRGVKVTNRSNTKVTMTPTLVDPASKPEGVEYEVSLKRGETTLWTTSDKKDAAKDSALPGDGSKTLAWGKDSDNVDELQVSVPAISITSETTTMTISKQVVAKVSLAFADAGKE